MLLGSCSWLSGVVVAMPAQLTTSTTSDTTTSPGWSKAQKSQLFQHVLRNGEKDWKTAVPGKTGQQVYPSPRLDHNLADANDRLRNSESESLESMHPADERWKTQLMFIKRTCGF